MNNLQIYVRQQLIHEERTRNLALLNEGFAKDLAVDAVQFAIAAGAEYGLGGITLPLAGAGVAVGPAVEGVVDAAFAAKDVADAVNAVKGATGKAGKFSGMLNDAVKSFGGDFGSYYEKVREIVVEALKVLTKGDFTKVEEIADEIQKAISEMVSALIGPIEKGIKLLIPDATAGLAAAKSVGLVLKKLAENAYDLLTSLIEKVDFLNNAITNPEKVIDFFEDVLRQVVELLKKAGEYFTEMSWAKALMAGGTGAALKKLGPAGMNKLAEKLEAASPQIVDVVTSLAKVVMPALFASLAVFQIIMKKEYKPEDQKNESTKRQIKALVERFSAEDFKDVYNTARMAHVGQKRRDGSEYFSHPSEVRNIARNFYPRDNVAQMAALLHDSLEDAPGSTVSSAAEMEDFIRGSIQDPTSADEVIRVVRALTHEKGGSYTNYVTGLLNDVPTLRVKLADMVHNLSDNPSPKQKLKYRSALDAISGLTGGKPPAGISPQHWQKLFSLTESRKMKITKRHLRRIIREAIQMLNAGDPVDTFDKVESLKPGDKITINGRASVVVDISEFNAILTYVADGKATLKDLDYRLAVRYDDDPADMLPEIEIIYMGTGQVPQKLRQPPRKKGPGRSYSVMD